MIVYRHRRLDNLEVFYIGIGSDKYRATAFKKRSKLWTSVYNKHGIIVEIIAKNLNKEEACELEEFLIELYGRRSEKTGNLVNFLPGGDHAKHCNESKKKMSIIANKRSKELLLKIKEKIPKLGNHYMARKVKNIISGKEYDSIKEASIEENIDYKKLRKYLSGERKNSTNIEYIIN